MQYDLGRPADITSLQLLFVFGIPGTQAITLTYAMLGFGPEDLRRVSVRALQREFQGPYSQGFLPVYSTPELRAQRTERLGRPEISQQPTTLVHSHRIFASNW